jgi:hypothetical protein
MKKGVVSNCAGGNPLKIAILALFLSSFAYSKSPIIRPDPADFSQISGFQADWCTETISPRAADSLCFGKSRFQGDKLIRSVLVKKGIVADLYVEDEWPGVELLKPRFGVIGPVLPSATGVEAGEVLLLLNGEGMEEGLVLQTPSLGTIRAARK